MLLLIKNILTSWLKPDHRFLGSWWSSSGGENLSRTSLSDNNVLLLFQVLMLMLRTKQVWLHCIGPQLPGTMWEHFCLYCINHILSFSCMWLFLFCLEGSWVAAESGVRGWVQESARRSDATSCGLLEPSGEVHWSSAASDEHYGCRRSERKNSSAPRSLQRRQRGHTYDKILSVLKILRAVGYHSPCFLFLRW